MRTLISTSGTSIAAGHPYSGDPQQYQRQIRGRLGELEAAHSDPADFLQRACAETNSLHSLNVRTDDRILLLTTETPDGLICAEEVARLLHNKCRVQCQIAKIEGLQVGDATRFRRVGIQKLFDALDHHCGDLTDGGLQTVLNVTGGFKSVVPYVTLYGLLHQLPVVYLFERSKSLLRLPPVPINFDYERLSQAMDALDLLQREGVIPKEGFFQAIPGLEYHRRDWYECLLEEDHGNVTISAFGALLLKLRDREQAQVFIGPAARHHYNAASGIAKEQFTFMLERVADPLWRKGKIHPFAGTDLTVFKPGNTSERLACIIRGDRVYVCELLRHDEYERTLPTRRASQYSLKGTSKNPQLA